MRELIIASLAFLFLDGFFLWFQSSIFTNQLQLIQGSETKLKILYYANII
jgi:hypothetical protein